MYLWQTSRNTEHQQLEDADNVIDLRFRRLF